MNHSTGQRRILPFALCAALPILLATCITFAQTQGWVLVKPPVSIQNGKYIAQEELPTPSWDYDSAYDTAKECERKKAEQINFLFEQARSPEVAKALGINLQLSAEKVMSARCVPYELWWGSRK